MTASQAVNDYITKEQKPVCDGCIAEALGIRNGQARTIAQALATTRDFERATGECSVCKETMKVTLAQRT